MDSLKYHKALEYFWFLQIKTTTLKYMQRNHLKTMKHINL